MIAPAKNENLGKQGIMALGCLVIGQYCEPMLMKAGHLFAAIGIIFGKTKTPELPIHS